jgi:hypothetical protein
MSSKETDYVPPREEARPHRTSPKRGGAWVPRALKTIIVTPSEDRGCNELLGSGLVFLPAMLHLLAGARTDSGPFFSRTQNNRSHPERSRGVL